MSAHNIPIPGSAAASVYEALKALALHVGTASVSILKRRVETGGYVYVISFNKEG